MGCVPLLMAVMSMVPTGCVVNEPAPQYAPPRNRFDRSWAAALDAAQDIGVQIDFENRPTGVISGSKDGRTVNITVAAQADGSVRVEISARGPAGSESLVNDISHAYDRRMGR